MRISSRFLNSLAAKKLIGDVDRIRVELRGSLALTGAGHATPKAVILGLLGVEPETMDAAAADARVASIYKRRSLNLRSEGEIGFDPERDIIFAYDVIPDLHPNAMLLTAFGRGGSAIYEKEYFSTGGGFIASRRQLERPAVDDMINMGREARFAFASADELLAICDREQSPIHEIIYANEDCARPREETDAAIDRIATVMMACIDRGLTGSGFLPGSLKVHRRAPALWQKLCTTPVSNEQEQLFDWLNVYAMAVNEENASGGQVVTAPTNGAAGIIPSIIRHYCKRNGANDSAVRKFLLTAGGIGMLYKQRASISGAEMGCQGEVGVACSMAAAGLAALWGASPLKVTSAAEIGMEHNLGLTCDPVGGLVQIPCIERNAIGTVKAVNAARLALNAPEQLRVSLDQVIETMRQTGLDMSSKYKETSQGGLAVNVVEC